MRMKMKIAIESRLNDGPELKRLSNEFEVADKDVKLCIALGGDGTFIRASRKYDVPILSIRDGVAGSTGYYSDLSVADMDFIIDSLKNNNYKVETLEQKLEVTYAGNKYYAINDAVIVSEPGAEVSLHVNQVTNGKVERIYPFVMSGDGIVVTGKVGSTAYNRSAGGPILLAPNVFCITFLSPDSPFKNSIVVDKAKEVELEVVKHVGNFSYDGIRVAKLSEGETIRIKLSDKELKVVRFEGKTELFAEKLARLIESKMIK
jgi:NAD+ kinase